MMSQRDTVNGCAPPAVSFLPSAFSGLLDLCSEVFCTLQKDGELVEASAATRTLWGYEPGELAGKPLTSLLPDEDHAVWQQAMARVLKGQTVKDISVRCRCRDGRLRPVRVSAHLDEAGEVIGCVVKDDAGTAADSNRQTAYQQILHRACTLSAIGWWEWNGESDGLFLSDELLAIFGVRGAATRSFTSADFLALVHPDERRHVLRSWAAIRHHAYYQYDHRLVKPSGETIHVIHYVQRETDESGRIIRWHGTAKDISIRKGAELALKRSEQRLTDIVDSLGDGFFAMDRAWAITYWNKKAELVTGRRRQEVVGQSFWSLYPKARTLKHFSEFHRAVAENQPVYFEEFSPTHGCWMELAAYPSQEGLSVYIKDISERKRMEAERRLLDKKLQQANDHLLRVLENMSDGFFTVGRDWTITFATDKMAAMLGVEKHNYVGHNLWECFPQIVDSRFYSEYHRAFAHNTLVRFEEYLAGFNQWFEINAYPSGDELSIYVKDITERKRKEQELRISNERFEFVSMATSDVIWDWDVQSGELYINQSFTREFGHELSDYRSAHQLWEDNLYSADRDRVIASQEAAIRNPGVMLWEDSYRFVKKCGAIAYVSDRAIIVRNDEGRALRMIGAVQDVTERRWQEMRLEFIAQATSEAIWERSIHASELQINGEKFRQLFGYEVCGNRIPRSFWMQKVHPDDIGRVHENREYALQHGLEFYLNEYRFLKADGQWAYVKDRTFIVRDHMGQPSSLIGALEDVTSQRLTERAIVESEKSYRQLFNNAPLPKMIIDAETLRYLDVNRTAVEHYGYSRDEFLQMTALDIRPAEDRRRLLQVLPWMQSHTSTRSEVITHLKKGGERMSVEVSVTLIDYKGKKALLCTINDVTEKLRLQNELTRGKVNHQKAITKAIIETQEQERSEIGKELHDNVNQMLTTAKLYVENISYYPEQSAHFLGRGVSILQASINEIRRLSKALVTPSFRDVGFKDTLRELVASYEELNLFEMECTCDLTEGVGHKGVQLTIYRILQEALNNTVKYASASLVRINLVHRDGELQVNYRDNGVGFDPAAAKTGIGLENIRNRTDAYLGKVQIISAPGEGCELKITFPLDNSFTPETI